MWSDIGWAGGKSSLYEGRGKINVNRIPSRNSPVFVLGYFLTPHSLEPVGSLASNRYDNFKHESYGDSLCGMEILVVTAVAIPATRATTS